MKSDREFLDGIYKKIQEHQNYEQKELKSKEKHIYHKGYKTLRPVFVTGIAIVLICSGIAAYDLRILPFSTKSSDIDIEPYSHTPNVASENMVRGIEPFGLSEALIPSEIEEAMKEGTVIRGKVTTTLESESLGEMVVEINKVYSGNEKIGSIINVKYSIKLLSPYTYNLLTGDEDILLYLNIDENNIYSLADETYGIFSYFEQVDGFDIFMGEDGVTLNTNIFAENVE